MKIKQVLVLSIIALFKSSVINAQWTDVVNKNINVQVTTNTAYYSGPLDGGGSLPEPTFNTKVAINNSWTNYYCTSIINARSSSAKGSLVLKSNISFYSQLQAKLQAHESDASPHCSYKKGDDDYYFGDAITRNGQKIHYLVYPHSDFHSNQWITKFGKSGITSIFPSNRYQQSLRYVWRYVDGNSINNPLRFEEIKKGITKSDVNSNRSAPSGANTSYFGYTNLYGAQKSNDVYYSFRITKASKVSVSTNSSYTNFDTFIYLRQSNGTVIKSNDNYGGKSTSYLEAELCPGTYLIVVEGKGSANGNFKLLVRNMSEVSNPNVTKTTLVNAQCTNDKGTAEVDYTGGIGPYSVNWYQGGSLKGSGKKVSLVPGINYYARVEDACKVRANSKGFAIYAFDTQKPVAKCASSNIDFRITRGQNKTLRTSDVNNGSTDNCGITRYTLSKTLFTASDEGYKKVTLTVRDAAGNSSTCQSTVNVEVEEATSIVEEVVSTQISVFPNPSHGVINLNINENLLTKEARLMVLDGVGRVVHVQYIYEYTSEIDLSGNSKGVYFLKVLLEGQVFSKKIIIK